MHQQVAINFGTLPLQLVLISDGSVALVKSRGFNVLYDQPEEGLQAAFFDEYFLVDGQKFLYNSVLRLDGVLKEYIKAQKMDNPFKQ